MKTHPVPVGQLLDQIARLAAKRVGNYPEVLFRCPTCEDTGWTLGKGTTDGGHADVEVATRCQGPMRTGCPYDKWKREQNPKKTGTSTRRMD